MCVEREGPTLDLLGIAVQGLSARKQRLQSRREPTRLVCEVKIKENDLRGKSKIIREADFRLTNRCVNAASRDEPLSRIGVRCHLFLRRARLEQIAVSDRGSLKGLTQFARSTSVELVEPAESQTGSEEAANAGTGVCDNLFQSRLQLVDSRAERCWSGRSGARLEIESGPRSVTHTEIAPSHSPSTTSRNSDMIRVSP